MNAAMVDRLITLANADGGWGATADRPSSTEHTALALMALQAADADSLTIDAAARWLERAQLDDGAWPVMSGVPHPSWSASLAVIALLDQPGSGDATGRGVDWLTAEQGIGIPLRERIREYFSSTKITALDPTLRGWPWVTGTFSWVEPTAWAIIALRRVWPDDAPRHVRERIDEGRRMILDRTCPGGGWNYGNKRVLGVEMEPYPDSTAVALLALGALRETSPEVNQSLERLDEMLSVTHSGLTLALSALCYREWGRDPAVLRGLLEQTYERTGFLDDVRSLALAVLALSEGPVPLVVHA